MLILDAQRALAFLEPQLAHIEREVYRIQYPAIRYRSLIPVDTTANPWTPSILFYSSDSVGQASWFSGKAQDVPNVDLDRNQFSSTVRMGAIGYSWNTEEISQAAMLNQNLAADKASGCRRISEEFIDAKALFGDVEVGFTGLVNCPYVQVIPIPVVAGNTTWATKTKAQVLADFNGILTGIYTGSNTVEMADTVLLPVGLYTYLADTPFNDFSEVTLLDYVKAHNVYTQETGRPLTIRSVRGLDTAGAGGTTRIVAYTKDPTVVKMHMPMPYRFLPVWQKGPMEYEVPGIFRIGGTDVRRPAAIRYADGA